MRKGPATIHLKLMNDQELQVDEYSAEFQISRTQIVDEALSEFFAKRKRKFTRRYGRVTGLGR